MKNEILIGLIGDEGPQVTAHRAIPQALQIAAGAISVEYTPDQNYRFGVPIKTQNPVQLNTHDIRFISELPTSQNALHWNNSLTRLSTRL